MLRSPVEVQEGEKLKLTCKLSGQPEPKLEWFKNGRAVKRAAGTTMQFDGKEAVLIIDKSTDEEEGTYKVVATNNIGTASSSCIVSVLKEMTKPQIIEKLSDVEGVEGSDVRLDTKIQGYNRVEWYCGFDRLLDGGKYHILQDDGEQKLSLVIKRLKRSDEGHYKCVAYNPAGKVTTRGEVIVTDKEFAPLFEDTDKNVVTPENREVNVSFTIRGLPKPTVTWYKDGIKLVSPKNVDFRSRGDIHSIVIYRATLNDTGSYRCEATNKLGTASCSVDIKVEGLFDLDLCDIKFHNRRLFIQMKWFVIFVFILLQLLKDHQYSLVDLNHCIV